MSLFSALADFGSSVVSGVSSIGTAFAGSPIGSAFLGQLGEFGVGKLADVIGLTPTKVSGSPTGFAFSPFSTFGPAPIGPLGTPAAPNPLASLSIDQWNQLQRLALQVRGMTGQAQQDALEQMLFGLGPQMFQIIFPTLSRGFQVGARTPTFGPPPSIPASQPFGRQPGDFTGGGDVAFPVTRQASFPAPTFLPALFGGTGGGVQQAGLAGSVLRQLPGIAGGLIGGELLESFAGGGGGGTPMFRPTMAGARAQFFRAPNPATGQDTWFRPAGRPILWSGDLTACKRVNKVARRARRKR